MGYIDSIANTGVMGILCSVTIAFVFIQAFVFFRKAWKRGIEIGMNREKMKKVVINSAVFSILPSLPVLIFLLVLMPYLGKFFPWLRLSVIGSGAYENLVANMTAQSFGLSGVSEGVTASVFLAIVWCMSLGIIWEPILTLFGSKFIQKGMVLLKGKNAQISNTVLTCLMIALYCIFAGPYLTSFKKIPAAGASALIPLLALITGAAATLLFNKLAQITKKSVFKEFSFPLSMISGMTVAIIINIIL